MKQTLSVSVTGKSGSTYSFNFQGDPQHIDEWKADGLDIVEIYNTIPRWAFDLWLARPWFAVQDAWRLIRLW